MKELMPVPEPEEFESLWEDLGDLPKGCCVWCFARRGCKHPCSTNHRPHNSR